jgi:hypothetical protein
MTGFMYRKVKAWSQEICLVFSTPERAMKFMEEETASGTIITLESVEQIAASQPVLEFGLAPGQTHKREE